jgi:hypothetical protein
LKNWSVLARWPLGVKKDDPAQAGVKGINEAIGQNWKGQNCRIRRRKDV